MKDEVTLARINMFAVLSNMANLCEYDPQAKELIRGLKLSITFRIWRGPCLTLSFKGGECRSGIGKKSGAIQLWFRSHQHFNRMMEDRAQPILLWGFTHIKFLSQVLPKLAKRLEYYLKPSPELLQDVSFRQVNSVLLMHAAINAVVAVANYDRELRTITKNFATGVVGFAIENGPAFSLCRTSEQLEVQPVWPKQPRAIMRFSDVDAACDLLNGVTDSFSCIAAGRLRISGYIPLLESLDKFLFRVNYYLR